MQKLITPINVTLFRHGETNYTEEPRDLTRKGILQIYHSALQLASALTGEEQLVIMMSSPRQRTQFSAEIISSVLASTGSRVGSLEIESGLDEVANFSWSLLHSLVNGGTVELNGTSYKINVALTNPKGLSVGKYYNSDAVNCISEFAMDMLPVAYVERIMAMETFSCVSARLIRVLQSITHQKMVGVDHVVLSTHNALAGFPAEVFTEKELTGIAQGESIDISITADGAFVTRVGDRTIGRSDIDLFQELHRHF